MDKKNTRIVGYRRYSHSHIFNPNATGLHDMCLDKDRNPCPKGSDASCLFAKGEDWWRDHI